MHSRNPNLFSCVIHVESPPPHWQIAHSLLVTFRLRSNRLSGFLVPWQYLGKGTNKQYCPNLFPFFFFLLYAMFCLNPCTKSLKSNLIVTIINGLGRRNSRRNILNYVLTHNPRRIHYTRPNTVTFHASTPWSTKSLIPESLHYVGSTLTNWCTHVMNRSVASEFPAPVPYLPMFPSISATLLVEIRLGYVLLAYSLWYFVIYFGNAL